MTIKLKPKRIRARLEKEQDLTRELSSTDPMFTWMEKDMDKDIESELKDTVPSTCREIFMESNWSFGPSGIYVPKAGSAKQDLV